MKDKVKKLAYHLKQWFWQGPLRYPLFVRHVRKVEKAFLPAFLHLAGQGKTVYLIVDNNDPEKIIAISIDPEFLTKARIQKAKDSGHNIIRVEKFLDSKGEKQGWLRDKGLSA